MILTIQEITDQGTKEHQLPYINLSKMYWKDFGRLYSKFIVGYYNNDNMTKSSLKGRISIELNDSEVEQLVEFFTQEKTITKKLRDFTADELDAICYNNDCDNCPLSFLTAGDDWCGFGSNAVRLTDLWSNFYNEYKFYQNIDKHMDSLITVKESELKKEDI